MALRAGRLNKRVTIQTATATQNSYGEEIKTWATHATRWAGIEPLQGAERWRAQQVNPTVSHRVTMRHLSSVVPKMRLKYGTRVFEIDAVLNPDEKGEAMELLCTENPDAEAWRRE